MIENKFNEFARTLQCIDAKLDMILERMITPVSKEQRMLHAIVPGVLQNVDGWDRVLQEAIDRCWITVVGDKLRWNGQQNLLAYFCGSVWAGDKAYRDKETGERHWKPGIFEFPGAALERLFDVKKLKQARYNGSYKKLPRGWEVVDEIVTARYINGIPSAN